MRIPRSIHLNTSEGHVHKYWRCHNREFLIQDSKIKNLYLTCTKEALKHKSVDKKITLSSYCLMGNHSHMDISYKNSSDYLSQFMRIAHSRFGSRFNKITKRSGKVANERPKTPLIENPEHNMRVHFYIVTNPIRAKMYSFENLKLYKHSSFRFYAYGIKDEFTEMLTIPKWYIELGDNLKKRQSEYRKLILLYLQNEIYCSNYINTLFIGNDNWVEKKYLESQTLFRKHFELKDSS